MSEKLKWGIIGAGSIAGNFATGVKLSKRCELLAVASRTQEKADAFGDKNDVPRRYGSYEALLQDPDVQAVYIATPHPMHAEWIIKSAEAGKHILCEKPVTLNVYEAIAVIEAARRHDVFFMEAFMYRCTAQTQKLVELLREKVIGDVKVIDGHFSFDVGNNTAGRHLNNALGGGGILDIGCYTTSYARLIAGVAMGGDIAEPIDVKGSGLLHPETGVDGYATAILTFPGNIIANLQCAVQLGQPGGITVYGSEGHLVVQSPWFCQGHTGGSSKIMVYRNGEAPRTVTVRSKEALYAGEADHVARHLKKRQGKFPAMSWSDTIGNMRTLDRWRQQLGFLYEAETPARMITPISGRPLRKREDSKMTYGSVAGLDKQVARLVMGSTLSNFREASIVWDEYVEQGGNAFDTAYFYGVTDGFLGQWMKNRGVRKDVVVIAKGAHTPDCNPEALRSQLYKSLENLQTDCADIYFMHRDNENIPAGEFVDVLNTLRDEGCVKIFGGSNWTLDRYAQANAYAEKNGKQGFSALSNNFSLARMVKAPWDDCLSASDAESRQCLVANKVPLFAWSSQAQGFFVPEISGPDKPGFGYAYCWYSDDNFERLKRAKILAAKRKVVPVAIALAYALQQKIDLFALFCPHNVRELATSLDCLKVRLSKAEMAWLNLEQDDAP
ncbi:MAG: aldo/keto reductase [Verrucomicrobia bacterium]|nr:aldo/keto reductase [Verrucomicrobiota bacterium]